MKTFDVRDFGAVGDGVTDDIPAFLRACRDGAEPKAGFVVISENICCGCSSPVFVGWYATANEAVAEVERSVSGGVRKWQEFKFLTAYGTGWGD